MQLSVDRLAAHLGHEDPVRVVESVPQRAGAVGRIHVSELAGVQSGKRGAVRRLGCASHGLCEYLRLHRRGSEEPVPPFAPTSMAMATPRAVAVLILISPSPLLVSPSSNVVESEPAFLVVSSRKHDGRFVLPKGGIEESESSAEAAEREAWEEAGLVPGAAVHLTHLLELSDSAPHKLSPTTDSHSPAFVPSTIYHFELFVLTGLRADALAEDWPEKAERQERKWVQGWDAIRECTSWGKRGEIMRHGLAMAKGRMHA